MAAVVDYVWYLLNVEWTDMSSRNRGLKGVTVSLSEEGRLSCSYLGTDPSMISHPSAYLRELDYASVEAEMKQLQRIIKEHQSKSCKRLSSISILYT